MDNIDTHPALAHLLGKLDEAQRLVDALNDSPETVLALRDEGLTRAGVAASIEDDRALIAEHRMDYGGYCRSCSMRWGLLPCRWPCFHVLRLASWWGWTTDDAYEREFIHRSNDPTETLVRVLAEQERRGSPGAAT